MCRGLEKGAGLPEALTRQALGSLGQPGTQTLYSEQSVNISWMGQAVAQDNGQQVQWLPVTRLILMRIQLGSQNTTLCHVHRLGSAQGLPGVEKGMDHEWRGRNSWALFPALPVTPV